MKKGLLFVCAVLLVAGVWWYQRTTANQHAVAYLTETVVRGSLTKKVHATGEVGAVQMVSVGAQVSGQIINLPVRVGQKVVKGELIAEIDSIPRLNQLETDKARLESYKAQLKAKEVALKVARTKYAREKQLKAKDAASRETLEDAENALALAEAQVAEQESLVRQTQIAVNTDEVNLGYTRITAPFDGTIVSVPVEEGQTVNANQTTPTIVQIADMNNMEIKIEISEGDIVGVRPGMPMTYTILSDPGTVYQAPLTSIDPGNTTLSNSTGSTASTSQSASSSSTSTAIYYYAKSQINNADGPLRIGMTTQNTITVASVENALLVPVVAVRAADGTTMVDVLTDGKPERRKVEPGLSDGARVEIRSGLQEGDAVITARLTPAEAAMQSQTRRGPRPFI